jgi:6-phosphogluconolactonase/glucosamine-6-phosphate isomerase/deaminase
MVTIATSASCTSVDGEVARPPTAATLVHVERDFEKMSRLGSFAIRDSLRRLATHTSKRPLNIVLSAGRTPTRTYTLLASELRDQLDWTQVALFQMDEYVGTYDTIESFGSYLTRMIVVPFQVRDWHPLAVEDNTDHSEWTSAIESQERKLAERGGIDLVVHGVGVNGHLGFNEPGSPPSTRGRVVELSGSTREAIARPAPTMGVTMGLATLLRARESILLASGKAKAVAVAAAIEGPLSVECPASWLRLGPRTTVIVDDDAAGRLHLSQHSSVIFKPPGASSV